MLVADDHVANRDLLRRLLAMDGLSVATATSGAEAIAVYCRCKPSLVLLDLNMPGVSGFEFLKWLRTEPADMRAPVIVLTASSDRETVQQAAQLGASAYIVKPFDGDDVRDRVRSLLGDGGGLADA